MLIRNSAHAGLVLSLFSSTISDLTPFALDFIICGPSVSLRSLGHLASTLPNLDSIFLGFPLSPHCFSRCGSGLPVVGVQSFGSSVPLRSPMCSDFAALVLDSAKASSPSLLKSLAKTGPVVSVIGLAQPGLFILVLGSATPDSFLSLHSSVRSGFSTSTLCNAHPDLILLVRSPVWSGSAPFQSGIAEIVAFEKLFVIGVLDLQSTMCFLCCFFGL